MGEARADTAKNPNAPSRGTHHAAALLRLPSAPT
jgi:hypothetical protein